jgi:hypothetical protein
MKYGRQIKAMQTTFQKKILMPGNKSISIANDLLASLGLTTAAEIGANVNMFDTLLRNCPSEPLEMIGDSLDCRHHAIV